MDVTDRVELPIREEDDILVARRAVHDAAGSQGFDPFAVAAITTATSELARNTWVHGRGGRMLIESVREGQNLGLHLRFEDEGPGIADLERVLKGGYSTGGSLGLGLSGSVRLVDDLQIDTAPDGGTRIDVYKWKHRF